MTTPKALLLDMDGLMIDTEWMLAKFWMQAAHEAGFPMELEHVLGIRSLAAIYAKPKLQGIFGEEFDYERIRARRRELTAQYIAAHGITAKAGLHELLHYAKAHGIRLAVTTATDRERTNEYLRQIGVYELFDAFICGDMVRHGKPDPETYLTASKTVGFAPEECFALEDSPNGILSAHAAGCKPVMIPDLSEPDDTIRPYLFACVKTLADVIPLLKGETDGKTE